MAYLLPLPPKKNLGNLWQLLLLVAQKADRKSGEIVADLRGGERSWVLPRHQGSWEGCPLWIEREPQRKI